MRAYAKLNIFLKILAKKGAYHELSSRFVLFDKLYDELIICDKKSNEGFELQSNIYFKDNIIYALYEKLAKLGARKELKDFFKDKALKLSKNIPHGGGLGGGSSDGAAFLKLMNKELKLSLNYEELVRLSDGISCDLPFFLSGLKSANVHGKGDIVEKFEDKKENIEISFSDFTSVTAKVFKEYAKNPIKNDINFIKILEKLKTKELLSYDNHSLNDLCSPCEKLYPKMKNILKGGYFLSGSGSCVFRLENNF